MTTRNIPETEYTTDQHTRTYYTLTVSQTQKLTTLQLTLVSPMLQATTQAVTNNFVLLMMGIIVPETC